MEHHLPVLSFKSLPVKTGLDHVKYAPYNPATNGLPERTVQTVKNSFNKCQERDLETYLTRLLFRYQNTPHSTTGLAPAEVLMGCKLKTHLDLMLPDIAARVANKQMGQRVHGNHSASDRSYAQGNRVYARNFRPGPRWLPGIVFASAGPQSLNIKLYNGIMVRRHLDHVRARHAKASTPALDMDFGVSPPNSESLDVRNSRTHISSNSRPA